MAPVLTSSNVVSVGPAEQRRRVIRKPAVQKAERAHTVALALDSERQEHLRAGARIVHPDQHRLDIEFTTDCLEPCEAPVERLEDQFGTPCLDLSPRRLRKLEGRMNDDLQTMNVVASHRFKSAERRLS